MCFERVRRELSIDVVEHRSILKNKGVGRILAIFQDEPMIRYNSEARAYISIDVSEHRSISKNYQNTL